MASSVTIERVTSPFIILGLLAFLVQVVTAGHVDTYTHVSIGLYAAFFGFCLPVYLGMVSGLAGGHPRPLYEALLPVAATLIVLGSAVYTFKGYSPKLPLAASFVSSLVFIFLQARGHGSSVHRRLALALPFITGLIIVLFVDSFIDMTAGLVFYSVLTMPLSVALVMLYSTRISDTLIIVYVVSTLVVSLAYALTLDARLLVAPLAASSLALASSRVWELLSKPVIGDAALAHIGLILVTPIAAYLLAYGDLFHAVHVTLLGAAVPMVMTQAPNIAPVLVAATWHRRRSRLYPSIFLLFSSHILWGVVPLLSQLLLAASVVWAFYALNPSLRRIYLILVYGTERGYMEAYLDASRS